MFQSKKNLDGFSRLVAIIDKQGPSYNPGNAAISSTALHALLEEGKKAIEAVHRAQVELTDAISKRHSAFDQLPKMATRIGGAAKACGLKPAELEDLKMFRSRFNPEATKDHAKEAKPEGAKEGPVSVTRQSRRFGYADRVVNFDIMVKFLESRPAYKPDQADLTVDALKAMLAELHALNDAVQAARVSLNAERMRRDKIIFGKETGIFGIALMVKENMKATFGFNSVEFKQVLSVNLKSM